MTKKDRIAIVASIIYLFVPITAMMGGAQIGIFLFLPIFIYWGYRFIQGDISFLGGSRGPSQ